MHTVAIVRSLTARTRPEPLSSLISFGLGPLLLAASGCVIPVAPQFDDPEPNFPPFVISSDPGEGEIVTPGQAQDNSTRAITVRLGDHNLSDRLYVRWLVDYPSADPSAVRLEAEFVYQPSPVIERSPP